MSHKQNTCEKTKNLASSWNQTRNQLLNHNTSLPIHLPLICNYIEEAIFLYQYFVILYWKFWLLNELKWKKFQLNVLNLVKHYNFGTRCFPIKDCLKNSKLWILKDENLKQIFETKNFKSKTYQQLTCRSSRQPQLCYINYLNIQGGLEILNFKIYKLKMNILDSKWL